MQVEQSEVFKRELPVKLTKDEILKSGQELAKIEGEIQAVDAEKKATNARFKFKKDELQRRRVELSESIEKGEENKEVDCVWKRNFSKKVCTLERLDTGAAVQTRTMTAEELQLEMDMGASTKKAKKTPKKRKSVVEDEEEMGE